MTSIMLVPSTAHRHFSDSIIKQPRPFTHAQSFSRRARVVSSVLPPKRRGAWSAVRRTLSSFRFRHRVRSDDVSGSASPHGAPFAAICEPGTVLPGEDGGATRPLIRQAFACLYPLLVQPRTAEPPSWPGRSTPAFRAQRVRTVRADAASCSAFKTPLESAPHEQDTPNIREVRSAGIRIPITKCFGNAWPVRCASLRGAQRRSNPVFVCYLDCFAEPVIGRRFAPPRWLAMTIAGVDVTRLISSRRPACAGTTSDVLKRSIFSSVIPGRATSREPE